VTNTGENPKSGDFGHSRKNDRSSGCHGRRFRRWGRWRFLAWRLDIPAGHADQGAGHARVELDEQVPQDALVELAGAGGFV
jgi:hypothetical protein